MAKDLRPAIAQISSQTPKLVSKAVQTIQMRTLLLQSRLQEVETPPRWPSILKAPSKRMPASPKSLETLMILVAQVEMTQPIKRSQRD